MIKTFALNYFCSYQKQIFAPCEGFESHTLFGSEKDFKSTHCFYFSGFDPDSK